MTPILLPVLALWGWQVDLLPWAVIMGLLIDGARFFKSPFAVRPEDFYRLWNVTALLFLAFFFYLFFARDGLTTAASVLTIEPTGMQLDRMRQVTETAMLFIRGLPVVLFPFIVIHAWGHGGPLPVATYSLYEQARSKRHKGAETPAWAQRTLHPSPPFLAVTLFASTASISHPDEYLPLFLIVVVMALRPWRHPHWRGQQWMLLLMLPVLCAVFAHRGMAVMRNLMQVIEGQLMQEVSSLGGSERDQQRTVTAIGTVGSLQQDGGTILRIESAHDPGLLREAAFNHFIGAAWSSRGAVFNEITSSTGPLTLVPPGPGSMRMTISRQSGQGVAPLSLPEGTQRIEDVPGFLIERNGIGAFRLRWALPLAIYSVVRGESNGYEGAPVEDDTDLSHLCLEDQAVIVDVANRIGLTSRTRPAVAVMLVQRMFSKDFTYDLTQEAPPPGVTPLEHFLNTTHRGHCEFYATATTLLLRRAGIPTRYAVGFSPTADGEGRWRARGRDAHAWCMAWIDGRWYEIDNTPGVWHRAPGQSSNWWESISDRWSDLSYRFQRWRQEGGTWRLVVFGTGIGGLVFLAVRQMRGGGWRRWRRGKQEQRPCPGMDSELLALATTLESVHGPRPAAQTLDQWLRDLGPVAGLPSDPLAEALVLHHRLRFDPLGLTDGERQRLRAVVGELRSRLVPVP